MSGRSWLAGIVAAAVALRTAPAILMGDSVEALPGIFDQVSYHLLAGRVLAGHGFTFAQPWWPMTGAGEPTAHWSYLYTLFLAGVYALAGVHPIAPRLLQVMVVGLATPWLTYRLARRVFGPAAGEQAALLAAAWSAVYGYFIYYSAALMTEAVYIAGILWTLEAALRLADSHSGAPSAWQWAELGLAAGLTCLLRQVFLLFVPCLGLWLAWALGPGRRSGPPVSPAAVARGAAIAGAVAALLIAPVTAFNYSRFGRFVLLNTNAGFAFFWSNHPIYGDRFLPLLAPGMPTYQELVPEELRGLDEAALDSALLRRGLEFVAADPGRFLRLSLSRLPAYFNFWPLPESSTMSNIVRAGSFGLALPFMLAGAALWWRAARRGGARAGPGALLLLFALGYSTVHLLSWALIRYRLPVDAVMLVFAGRAAAGAWHIADRRWRILDRLAHSA